MGQTMSDVFDDLDASGLTVEERSVAMPDFAVQLLTVRWSIESSQAMSTLYFIKLRVPDCRCRANIVADMGNLCVQALAQVHARGFIHGDVTAANVFMCEPERGAGGTIKLIDFGHAQTTAFKGARTRQAFVARCRVSISLWRHNASSAWIIK